MVVEFNEKRERGASDSIEIRVEAGQCEDQMQT